MPVTEQAPTHNLTTVIGRNTAFGLIANGAQIATRLVTVPMVIGHLGLGAYGIWSIIMTAAAYMRLGSAGTKSAFQKYVAEAVGNQEYETANTLLSTGTALTLGLSVAGLIPMAIFSRAIAHAAGVPTDFLDAVAGSIAILALIMVFANAGSAYEAVLLGGQRIDLTRTFGIATSVAEAVAIIALLNFGYGLFAMAAVMAVSQLVYTLCCCVAAHRVVPQITLSRASLSKSAIRELVRFAGSYQLVGVLQVIYGAVVPVAVLRVFGAHDAGVLAVAGRLLAPIGLFQSSFLTPILSGGAMVYASGWSARMEALLVKSFKVTLVTTLVPIAILLVAGTEFITAWIGQGDPRFRTIMGLCSLTIVFSSFGQLAFVLYRVTGRALIDNVREIVRIAIILGIATMTYRLGLYGVLGGLAFAELVGMIVMIVGMKRAFRDLTFGPLVQDALRMAAATLAIMAVGALVAQISLPSFAGVRAMAAVKSSAISIAMLLAFYPALLLTGSVSPSEVRSVFGVFKRGARAF